MTAMANHRTSGRITNKKGYYLFDLNRLLSFKEERATHDQFATLIGVSRQNAISFANCVNDFVLVNEDTAIKISQHLGVSIKSLIYKRSLPTEPEFYEDIRYGYFIDNAQGFDDKEPNTPKWFSEAISLERVPNGDARTLFSGSIINCCQNHFSIRAERVSDYIFSIASTHDDQTLSFVGVATKHVYLKDIDAELLMGTWSGIDISGYMAVFRWILSNKKLIKSEIEMICKDFHIEYHIKATNFHQMFNQ
jgi:hypothetical protein